MKMALNFGLNWNVGKKRSFESESDVFYLNFVYVLACITKFRLVGIENK